MGSIAGRIEKKTGQPGLASGGFPPSRLARKAGAANLKKTFISLGYEVVNNPLGDRTKIGALL
jgi:hypothetical protein